MVYINKYPPLILINSLTSFSRNTIAEWAKLSYGQTVLKSKRETETFEHDPIESAQKIGEGYADSPVICHHSGRAVYFPKLDRVSEPP